mgnify:CR=1 FL=1
MDSVRDSSYTYGGECVGRRIALGGRGVERGVGWDINMGDTEIDYCIVGSGPAGTTVAEVLAARGASVALVEQGPRHNVAARGKLLAKRQAELQGRDLDFDHADSSDFKNPVTTSGGVPYSYNSLSAVGGASLHWDGHTPRPRAEDMRVRSLYGYGRDWPIAYKEFEPWLLKAEHAMGVSANDDNPYASPRSGPFPMPAHPQSYFESTFLLPAMQRLGWTAHSRANAIASQSSPGRSACLGCRQCSICPSGARYSADLVSLPKFLAQEDARLYSETKLRRLEVSKDGRTITSAIALDKAGREQVFKAKRFVLAMGGVETPRMLLLSTGPGHSAGLGNHDGQVGVGFSDHLMRFFQYTMPKKVGHSLGFPAMNCEHFRAPENRKGIASFSLNMIPGPVSWDFTDSNALVDRATFKESLSLDLLQDLVQRGVVGYSIHEHTGVGQLSLDESSKDSFGDALPKISIGVGERDLASFVTHEQACAKLGETLDAEYSMPPWSTGGSAIWASHPSGGTAMGTSRKNAVCDQNLKVMGTENLFVVSSSVFPHAGANNPTLSIVALALRLANHLLKN